MNTLVLDLETTTEKYLGRTASPFSPDNWIVAAGWQLNDGEPFGDYLTHKQSIPIPDLSSVDLIIAHNAKFDLLYLWDYPELRAYFKRGGRIWCTQLAEYLLNGMGQNVQMNSLNQCAMKYGGNTKIDAVKEMWEAGVNTPDIPKDLLMDYLLGTETMEGDIGNTWRVYQGQLEALKRFPKATEIMLHNRMESLLATTEMEYNGLFVNKPIGEAIREELNKDITLLSEKLWHSLPTFPDEECEFKWSSVYDKSALLYGGTKKYSKWVQHVDEAGEGLYAKKTEKWPLVNGNPVHPEDLHGASPDTFKSGKRVGEVKTKNMDVPDLTKPKGAQKDHFFVFPGITSPAGIKRSTLTTCKDEPIYSTDGDTIQMLGKRDIPFLKDMSEHASKVKDCGTYYWKEDARGNRTGMLTQVGDDGIIHHSLNHTSTVTGRMSSSNPNLQNLPRKGTSEVKKMFESRFGDDGYIVEMDYAALEVYVQAILTGDQNMQGQIASGIDFHCYRLSMKLHEPYAQVVEKCKNESHPQYKLYDAMRTQVKGFSFQLAYGAGAAAIADSIGMDVDEVKKLMENEHVAYPNIKLFDERVQAQIEASYQLTAQTRFIGGMNVNVGVGSYMSPTGTRYQWTEQEAPKFMQDRGQLTSFSPTERKNYPTQGFGGEIMQTMLGVLWRWFISKDHFDGKCLLVNTVHDSAYLDCHKDLVHTVIPMAVRILASVRQKFNNDFDMGIPIDFKVDADLGKSMYTEKGYDQTKDYT